MINKVFINITYTILFFIITFIPYQGISQAEESISITEFIEGLSFKGPEVGGTFEKPDQDSHWAGSIIYSNSTKYINWFFAFAYDGMNGMPIDFEVRISKGNSIIYKQASQYDFLNGDGFYFDGFKLEDNKDWPAGIYTIGWYVGDYLMVEKEFKIIEDDLGINELKESATIRDFEIYFKENKDAFRDYNYVNNYHFPQDRTGLIAWRISLSLPYSINNYNLKTEVKVFSLNGDFIDSKIINSPSDSFPGSTSSLEWSGSGNWPKGSYKMEFFLEDRYIASREFHVE